MSSPKSIKDNGSEDLSIRARRFGLSLDEQHLLDRACEASPTLRVSHQVGRDFDRVSVVRAGDEELIARVADRVLKSSRRGIVRGRLAWGVGVAVVLISSGAAAWWTGIARPRPPAFAPGGEPSAEVRPSARRPATSRIREAPAEGAIEPFQHPTDRAEGTEPPRPVMAFDDGTSTISAQRDPHLNEHRSSSSVVRTSPTPKAAPDGEGARELFRKASAARHIGDFAAAAALYGKLQASFPTSDEARLSHVSLGKLLLASGNAIQAERQFSLYLSVGGRELAEEALVGRAESLQRLGRAIEERQSWQRLLQESPASVYAARARQRLEELEPR
jgi:hypothetical protein